MQIRALDNGATRRASPAILGVFSALIRWAVLANAVLNASGDEAFAMKPTPEQSEFFELRIRPLLAEHCQKCHGASVQKSGLRLDSRAAILSGGLSGPAAVPGKPDESLLIDAVNHGDVVQMPPKSKLPADECLERVQALTG